MSDRKFFDKLKEVPNIMGEGLEQLFTPLVSARSIQFSSLHILLPSEYHPYNFPFGIVYAFWAYVYLVKFDDWLGSNEVARLGFIMVLSLHALSFLICQWSVDIKSWLTCKNVLNCLHLASISNFFFFLQESDPFKATIIKIIPIQHHGRSEMCEIKRTPSSELYFFFQKKKYIYDTSKKTFEKLSFPASNGNHTMDFFQNSKGIESEKLINSAKEKYGLNRQILLILKEIFES
ncbi:hypothetical protein HK096_003441 [Nowakowskiella sp. JEL0078]|nr:hypothetical protein HK096_003441 [Nowakowskiella sp. JEL0078]